MRISEEFKNIDQIRECSELGDYKAQYELGVLYEIGEQFPQDYVEAFKWYEISAELGNIDAQKKLGFAYYNGLGTQKNSGEGYAWYKAAAGQGDQEAQYHIGSACYEANNHNNAYLWLSLSLTNGYEAAGKKLTELESIIDPKEKEKAQVL